MRRLRTNHFEWACVVLASASLYACQVEVNRRDHWADKAKQFERLHAQQPRENTELAKLRVENPDGTTTLNCYLPENLVMHLRNCIAMAEVDLIYDQLLSDAAKQVYIDEDRDPHEAVDWLITNQRDVIIMLNRMTAGLSSPDVSWQSLDNTYRMQIVSPVRTSLRFTTLDLIREEGQFKLLLIS